MDMARRRLGDIWRTLSATDRFVDSRFSVGSAVSRPRHLAPGGLPQSVRARRTKASLGAGIREEETLAVVGRVDRGRNGKRGVGSIRVVDCRR